MKKRYVATLLIFAAALALVGAGCASTHMKRYLGKDVRYIVLDDGHPENVMDMPDGTRAFQFRWGGGSYYVPRTTTTSGQIQLMGNSAYYSENKLESGGAVVTTRGCLLTYFAKWNAEKKGWIVERISWPRKLVCSE